MPGAATPTILFTAFEPSGDEHGALAIRALRRRAPEVRVLAWGGERMRNAGATVLRNTCDNAVMGLPGLATIREHLQLRREFKRWARTQSIDVHVAVDSPAANNPLCKVTKRRGARVAHLVAPQLWAWAPWRVRRLRRLTDHLLCLLPFEPAWFGARGVEATFVGHPIFDEPLDADALDATIKAANLPAGDHKVALMPGSRPSELRANFPAMLEAFAALRRNDPGVVGVVAATTDTVARQLREMADNADGWPDGLGVIAGDAPAAIRWCDIALAVSGTVTLHIARQTKPMVIIYAMPRLTGWIARKFIVKTPYVALPNVIAGREIVRELFPFSGKADRLTSVAGALLRNADAQTAQRDALAQINAGYKDTHAGDNAADVILALARIDNNQTRPRRAVHQASIEQSITPKVGPEGLEPSRELPLSGF